MSETKALAAFRLFHEKSEKLSRSGFMWSVQNEPLSFNISWHHETGTTSERAGPSQDLIDAAVLTYRFFILNNEQSSLQHMTRHFDALHSTELIEDATLRKWHETRDKINASLDRPTMYSTLTEDLSGKEVEKETHTYGRIMEVIINGGLAHANNPEMVRIYKEWESYTNIFPLVQTLFIDILSDVIIGLDWLRRFVVEPAIQQIESKGQRSGHSG